MYLFTRKLSNKLRYYHVKGVKVIMKKGLILSILMISFFMTVQGQNYKTGLGIRAGLTSGLTAKYFFEQNTAVEGILGIRYRGIHTTVLIEKQTHAFNTSRVYWIYGLGGHIGFYNNGTNDLPYDADYGRGPELGVDGIVGLEYDVVDIPFTLGVDIKPFFDLVAPAFVYWDLGFTVRYVF